MRPKVYTAPGLAGSHVVIGGWAFFDGDPAILPDIASKLGLDLKGWAPARTGADGDAIGGDADASLVC